MRRLVLLSRLRFFLTNCRFLDRLGEPLFLRCGHDGRRGHRFSQRLKCHQTDNADAKNRRNAKQVTNQDSKATHYFHSTTTASTLSVVRRPVAERLERTRLLHQYTLVAAPIQVEYRKLRSCAQGSIPIGVPGICASGGTQGRYGGVSSGDPSRLATSFVTAGNYNWNSRNRDGLGAFLWPNSRAQSALTEAEARHVDHAVYDRRRRRALPRSRGGGLVLREKSSAKESSVLSRADESHSPPVCHDHTRHSD